jgi:hypothetical protein
VPLDEAGDGRAPHRGHQGEKSAMKIAVHIPFYYNDSRLKYLNKLLSNIDFIGGYNDVDIYLYTNKYFTIDKLPKVQLEMIKVAFPDLHVPRKFFTYLPFAIRKHVDPYYLTWKHRELVHKFINTYDIQMYIEDDIDFTYDSLQYWIKYKDFCIPNGYNLGFIRIEFDARLDKWFCSELTRTPDTLIKLGDLCFARSVGYYGFWIYDKAELQRFAESKQWRLKHAADIRERAALGWHGIYLGLYKYSIVPLQQIESNKYTVCPGCSVHHMPNTYIHGDTPDNYPGDPAFCTIEFPPQIITAKG